jgi:hypothetical protein
MNNEKIMTRQSGLWTMENLAGWPGVIEIKGEMMARAAR